MIQHSTLPLVIHSNKITMLKKILLFFAFAAIAVSGYSENETPQLPYDKDVKFGKLENGLTYYIRKNSYVPGRANFYIAQKVGSILEKPQQRGLAHFLEHMAFNGTKHFPDKQLINYLETIGVKFGANLNAYTSVDKTVYHFTDVPVTRPQIVDSCLLILRDWSDGITLSNDEIEKERGVIEEEWRTSDNAFLRMYNTIFPIIFKGSKYADCLPIGDINVIRNFKPEDLKAYYNEWYRPDLQGIIIVGDIDVDYVYNKVEETFKDCRVAENPSERVWYSVNDNFDPIIVSSRDKENTSAGVLVSFKHDRVPAELRNTATAYLVNYSKAMIEGMLNNRFEELMQKPGSPFAFIMASDEEFLISNTKDAFEYYCGCSDANIRASLVKILEENERVTRYGFTVGEYERAKADFLKSIEKQYNEKEKTKNKLYASEYLNNFLRDEPFPGIENEFLLYNNIASIMSVDQINEIAKHPLDRGNIVIWMRGTENEKVEFPSDSAVMAIMDSISKAEIAPYVDNTITEPLTPDIKSGTIVKEKQFDDGSYSITLSNGVQVDVKPTTLKDDEVLMKAIAKGGVSSFYKEGDNTYTIDLLNDMAAVGGLGNFSTTDLKKALAGKNVNILFNIGHYTSSIVGSSGKKDIESLMQLIYLSFTSIREDDDAYNSLIEQYDAYLRNADAYPTTELTDSISSIVYGNAPLMKRLKAQNLKDASYKDGLEIIRKLFSNAKDYNFVFTGNIDIESFRQLICKYIASLPTGKATSKINIIPTTPIKGERTVSYRKVMENPKTTVKIVSDGKLNYNLQNIVNIKALDHIMDIVYFEKIREADGGTYGVHSSFSSIKIPTQRYLVNISMDTDSSKYEKLIPLIFSEIKNIAESGPRQEDVDKAKEYLLKVYTDAQVTNNYYLEVKSESYITGLDISNGYVDAVNKITKESVQKLVQQLLSNIQTKQIIQIGKK